MHDMQVLIFPRFDCKIIRRAGKRYMLDHLRKKYIQITPEEWVRQHVINYLIHHKGYPAGYMRVENKIVKKGDHWQRADITIYHNHNTPLMIIECKSPDQPLKGEALTQLMRYNTPRARFLVWTNGVQLFCFQLDSTKRDYTPLKEIPDFPTINHR